MPTELNSDQRALLYFLLSRQFPGRAELLRQAATVRTAGLSCGCGCPSFSLVPDKSVPAAQIEDPPIASDAHGTDPEGNKIGVLLFVDESGFLSEIEIYSIEGDDFGGLPKPSALKLSEWSEPDGGTRVLLNP